MGFTPRTALPRAAGLAGAAFLGGGLALGGAALFGGFDGNTTTIRELVSAPATAPASFSGSSRGGALSINEIYRRDAPGVVQVTSLTKSAGLQQQEALGSGFVIDKAGHVITNFHVVDGASTVQVSFSSNESLEAKIVGVDPSTDIAVLQVKAPSRALTPLTLGDSDTVKVGDQVIAIGNPFGLDRTVTAGIVSALQREIQAPNDYSIDHIIQTDAPINHGNSGGPLINAAGGVIGVNAQIETGGSTEGNVGIGFAIPIDTVKGVVAQLIKNGKVEHAFIGISVQPVTHALARAFRLPVDHGLLIETVQPRSGAARAGLKAGKTRMTLAGETYLLGGDVIVGADGRKVDAVARLRDVVAGKKPGDELELEIYRGSKKQAVAVELGKQPPLRR